LGITVTAALASPLAGCGLLDRGPDGPTEPDPLTPLLTEALDLASRHEAAVTAYPELADRLTPVAQAHRAHAAELSKIIGAGSSSPSVPSTPLPSDSAVTGDQKSTLAALRDAEQKAQKAAAEACRVAPEARAALVGSIAAARATHLEVTR
jgi:hypothetical protein